jgi:hypothetical protein
MIDCGIFTAPVTSAIIAGKYDIDISDNIELLGGLWVIIAIPWFAYRWKK